MDHFEAVVQTLLETAGHWVRSSYKVDLTKAEKRATGKPSIPRPEIDLLVFNQASNQMLALEVKSYLDSPGVKLTELQRVHDTATGRYKLFTSTRYRRIVLKCLRRQLIEAGAINQDTRVLFGLAAGKVYKGEADALRRHLRSIGAIFIAPEEIRARVRDLANRGYENNPTSITAKILVR